jgi:hypothetical protein
MLLAYCTNIHPAESWMETFHVLKTHALAVRDELKNESIFSQSFPLAPRLSARAAIELLEGDNLSIFKQWLKKENCHVFTINGFPYGAFHGTRVKENVYKPDWTKKNRLYYTRNLFQILVELLEPGQEGSVSTLPGSFKSFEADEKVIIQHLLELADEIEDISMERKIDLHLGLEPEPLGYFENTEETIAFFERLFLASNNPEMVKRRIGVNYDTCHFSLEYNDCEDSLNRFHAAGIRISKVHLSAALSLDPKNDDAIKALHAYDESTYLHQVLLRDESGKITRFTDLPDFFNTESYVIKNAKEARVHFHIPLDADPQKPLSSTRQHAVELLGYRKKNPDFCQHYEIETYTWGVLPENMHRPIEQQLAAEYRWVLEYL